MIETAKSGIGGYRRNEQAQFLRSVIFSTEENDDDAVIRSHDAGNSLGSSLQREG